ncbi:MAG TPA: hypothetical protein VG755_11370 [Nannocystaceae bacterium]|nr:hypothetical protein [Nannocystaceae bacterium]
MAHRDRLLVASLLLTACPAGDDDADTGLDTTAPSGESTATTTAASTTAASTTTAGSTTSSSDESSSDASDDAASSSDGGSDTGGTAHVPDGVLFFDGFDYDVARDMSDKFVPGSAFVEHGWSWGKDAVLDEEGAGGWLWTSTSIPGYEGALPGVDSTHVLCVESGAGTYAGVIEGAWRQTDFYLQYGDVEQGPLDTIPADVWFQHWLYVADTEEQPSLFPPTNRLGKWIYPTRSGYPSQNLEWLFSLSGIMIDSETYELGSSAMIDIGTKSLGFDFALTDTDNSVYTDGRPDGAHALGHCGDDPDYLSTIDTNRWWLVRMHVDHTTAPAAAQVWIRPYGGEWIKLVDSLTSPVVEWTPVNTTEGHRGLRFPTTMSNWYQVPEMQTTHGDWWIYVDDFAIAAGEHAGGNGADDLPQYYD